MIYYFRCDSQSKEIYQTEMGLEIFQHRFEGEEEELAAIEIDNLQEFIEKIGKATVYPPNKNMKYWMIQQKNFPYNHPTSIYNRQQEEKSRIWAEEEKIRLAKQQEDWEKGQKETEAFFAQFNQEDNFEELVESGEDK